MRTLLRHTETGLFFQGPDKWTCNTDIAYDFRFAERARQFVRTWELQNVEVSFVFEDWQSVSNLPLNTAELSAAA